MITVDTHVHVGLYKYEPVEALLDQMNRNKVDKGVLVQYMGNSDNGYLLECSRRFPDRFSGVIIVDSQKADAGDTLARWNKKGAWGIRLRAGERSTGKEPFAIWQAAADLGMVVSCIGKIEEFASDEFENLLKELPSLTVVIEHLGGVGPDEKSPYTSFRKVLALAKYPNTYIKLPGYGEFCGGTFPFSDIPPFVQMTYDAFGSTRMMWGSDFPPVSSREGYRNALDFPLENMAFRSEEDKEFIFGKTALSVWKFDQG